jgi:predicted PurR-regulated permease PerM
MSTSQAARRFFFLLLAIVTLLVAFVVRPLATALFLAVVLAGGFWPVHQRLSKRLWQRPPPPAGLLVLGIIVVLLRLLAAFSAFAVREGSEGVKYLNQTLRSKGVSGLGPLVVALFLALLRMYGRDFKPAAPRNALVPA